MEKLDLVRFTEEFIEKLVEPLNVALADAKDAKEVAVQHFRDCAAEYDKDMDARNRALMEKAEAVERELEALGRQNHAALDKLSVALSTGNAVEEAAAQTEIDDIAAAEYVAQRRLDTVRKVKISGNDMLYEATLQAFADFHAARLKYKEQTEAISGVVKILLSLLEDVQNRAELGSDGHIGYGADLRNAGKKAWKVVEQHNGPVDFSGSTAMGEDDRHARYAQALALKKMDPAFERSPAGEQLKQAIRNRLLIAGTKAEAAQNTSTED